MKFSIEKNETNYEQIWLEEFWTPLVDSEHFAISKKDIQIL